MFIVCMILLAELQFCSSDTKECDLVVILNSLQIITWDHLPENLSRHGI